MTDFEKMKSLFDEFEIHFSVVTEESEVYDTIELYAKTKNVEGYSGFYTYFEFSKQGEFKKVGIYE